MNKRLATAAGSLSVAAALGVLAAGPALAVGSLKVTGPTSNGGSAILASATGSGVALTSKTYVAISRSGMGTCSVVSSALKCTSSAIPMGTSSGTATANITLACVKATTFVYTVYSYNSSVGTLGSVSASVKC